MNNEYDLSLSIFPCIRLGWSSLEKSETNISPFSAENPAEVLAFSLSLSLSLVEWRDVIPEPANY